MSNPKNEKQQANLNLYPNFEENSQYKNLSDSEKQEQIESEIKSLLAKYTQEDPIVYTDNETKCPLFFAQLADKTNWFNSNSNKARQTIRKNLVKKLILFKDGLDPGDSRFNDLTYYIDKLCYCTKECAKPTKTNGGKRKTKRRGRKTKKTRRKRF